LKVLLRSGTTKYSNIVRVRAISRSNFSQVIGVGSDRNISFKYISDASKYLQFSLTDVSGRKLSNNLFAVKAGMNSLKIEPPGSVTEGIYLLRVSEVVSHSSRNLETFKVIVN
jgi:hypothetical protein